MTATTLDPPASLAAYSDSLAAIVETLGAATLAVLGRHGRTLASAVVWKPGVVVTAAHGFRRVPAAVTLAGADGKPFEATLAGADAATDLAAYRVAEDRRALPAAFGDPNAVKPGSLVIAVGRSASGDLTASHGIVNKTGGPWQTWLGGQVDRLIRLDGGLHQGLSGGAVADARGAVIGIATAALSRSHGVVVPVGTVTRVVEALLADGRVARPYLGIAAQAAAAGLLITDLAPDGPAAVAGLRVGDVLTALDGAPVTRLHELRAALADKVGRNVQATRLRGDERADVALTVAPWPARESARGGHCR